MTHFLQSSLNLEIGSTRSTTIAARSMVEFPGTVIQEVPQRTTPVQLLQELEKRLWLKQRIHITTCKVRSAINSKLRDLGFSIPIQQLTKGMSGTRSLLDAVQLAETLGTAGVRSPQVCVLWGTVKHIWQGSMGISLLHSPGRSNVPWDVQQAISQSGMSVRKFSLYTLVGRKAGGKEGDTGRNLSAANSPCRYRHLSQRYSKGLRIEVSLAREDPSQPTWPASRTSAMETS
ncbi:hypothetical protein AMTR_s00003p00173250 [Amborella trichopoda]|uniref:Uncharacterized protein n=1 Tax=Amborella trichopoda TaxID=13333 RepID=W1P8C0_AMBTC|nr:hypothetical protein AMTR_s00003p00173250 [Amborella trichopoda]